MDAMKARMADLERIDAERQEENILLREKADRLLLDNNLVHDNLGRSNVDLDDKDRIIQNKNIEIEDLDKKNRNFED